MGSCLSAANDDDDDVVPGTLVSGTHEFTIRRYSEIKGAGAGKSILSRHFDVDGRKWFVRFYPGGYRTDQSLFVAVFVQTLYRPQLRAVRADFSFELLRPDGAVAHARRTAETVSFDRCCNCWGFRLFIAREELESAALGVLGDQDSIRVRCTVDVVKDRRRRRRGGGAGVVPRSEFGENARRFLASGRAPCDVRFDVGGRVFEAHRLAVAAQSEWFAAALYGHGGEGAAAAAWAEASLPCVRVEGTSPEAFEAVLHYIYHDALPEELMRAAGEDEALMAREVFEAADMFLIERLKKMCAGRLCRFIRDDTVDDILELAMAHSCVELRRACLSHLARRRAFVWRR
ncbi:hypothetical protein ACP4OV_026123 [Aristida adscensionis]